MIIFDGQLTANTPATSNWFALPSKAIIASSTDYGDFLATGETFEISTALIGDIGGKVRLFPDELLIINNRDFHLITAAFADQYQIWIYPSIDMHLLLEVL